MNCYDMHDHYSTIRYRNFAVFGSQINLLGVFSMHRGVLA